MRTRTPQDLLAERRYNVQEARHETDPMAKAMLLAHVAVIDAELRSRRKPACLNGIALDLLNRSL